MKEMEELNFATLGNSIQQQTFNYLMYMIYAYYIAL